MEDKCIMSNDRDRYLLKNTVVFVIGNIATKLIAFFLVPLYTHVLTTYEYGIVDLVVTICTVAVPVITLNISEAVMRFNLDKQANNDRITKAGLIVLGFGILFSVILIPVCNLFEKTSDLGIFVLFYVIFSASSQVLLGDLRGKELQVKYSIGNVLNTFLIVLFNILFLLVFNFGIRGYLSAYAIANAIVTVYALIVGKGYKSFAVSFDQTEVIKMLKYSIVLIPNSFMWWIMNSFDHVMVTGMIGAAANGIYAVSYKIPTLITAFTSVFNQAWQYSAIKEEGAADETEYNNKVFHNMIAIVMFVGIIMMSVIKPFLKMYVSNEYYDSWKYTPFLIVGCVFITMGTFMSTSYTVHKDSYGFLLSGSFGALLNVLLNYILIPTIGVYGAAIATCISYISVFVFRLFHTRKYIKYNIMIKEFILGSVFLVISGFLIFKESIETQIGQILLVIVYTFFFHKRLTSVFVFTWKSWGKERKA